MFIFYFHSPYTRDYVDFVLYNVESSEFNTITIFGQILSFPFSV